MVWVAQIQPNFSPINGINSHCGREMLLDERMRFTPHYVPIYLYKLSVNTNIIGILRINYYLEETFYAVTKRLQSSWSWAVTALIFITTPSVQLLMGCTRHTVYPCTTGRSDAHRYAYDRRERVRFSPTRCKTTFNHQSHSTNIIHIIKRSKYYYYCTVTRLFHDTRSTAISCVTTKQNKKYLSIIGIPNYK